MEFRQLRHFLAVYDAGSYAEAARNIDLTQQAISASIAKLEQNLGVTLFYRDKSGARPTSGATRLVPYARSLIHDAERAAQEMNAVKTGHAGEVHAGVALMPHRSAMSLAIRRFQQERPGVTLYLRSGLMSDLLDQLEDGALEFVIGVPRNFLPVGSHVRLEPLFDNLVRVACSTSHPLATKNDITFRDLSSASWILPPPGSPYRDYLIRTLTKRGFAAPTSFMYSDSFAVGADILDLGEHLVISHEGMMQPFFNAGIFKMLPIELDPTPIKACIAYRPGAVLSEPAKALIENLRQQVGQVQQDGP